MKIVNVTEKTLAGLQELAGMSKDDFPKTRPLNVKIKQMLERYRAKKGRRAVLMVSMIENAPENARLRSSLLQSVKPLYTNSRKSIKVPNGSAKSVTRYHR